MRECHVRRTLYVVSREREKILKKKIKIEKKILKNQGEAKTSEFAEQETIEVSRWLNSLSDISESNNVKFTNILNQHGYVHLDSLYKLVYAFLF